MAVVSRPSPFASNSVGNRPPLRVSRAWLIGRRADPIGRVTRNDGRAKTSIGKRPANGGGRRSRATSLRDGTTDGLITAATVIEYAVGGKPDDSPFPTSKIDSPTSTRVRQPPSPQSIAQPTISDALVGGRLNGVAWMDAKTRSPGLLPRRRSHPTFGVAFRIRGNRVANSTPDSRPAAAAQQFSVYYRDARAAERPSSPSEPKNDRKASTIETKPGNVKINRRFGNLVSRQSISLAAILKIHAPSILRRKSLPSSYL